MSSKAAVVVRNLGKRYELSAPSGTASRYRTLREDLSMRFRHTNRSERNEARILWALRDLSLNIRPGERVGLIGRNGAGKSTLLKVLARITAPTTGYAEVRGRVGSLLEVGTGFHPELSGRDNIYLSGAILGMRKAEITSKVDDIVAFAGVDRFLDTPTKRYSSGMQLRLAFAVAAHLDTDILLIDEVLAVGDAEFQKKCMGRMSDLTESGRTILFVSHSMPAVLRLCDRVILLDGGEVVADGDRHEVIRTYLESGLGSGAEREWRVPDLAPGDNIARFRAVRVRSGVQVSDEIDIRHPVDIEVDYWRLPGNQDVTPTVFLQFTNDEGTCLFHSAAYEVAGDLRPGGSECLFRATCHIPGNFLAEGRVMVHAWLASLNPTTVHAHEIDAVSFQVVDKSDGDGVRGEWGTEWPGVVRPKLDWTSQTLDVVLGETPPFSQEV